MNDGGKMAVLEQWMADVLAALTDDSALVFKTADVWKHQVAATNAGFEASLRYSPFAFVSYQDCEGAREGDHDLREVFTFAVLIGVDSKEDGVARFGDATHLGTSKIRDLVISAFDRKRPDNIEIACDEFYYAGDLEILDQPKRHWLSLSFEVSFMNVES